MLVLVRKVLVIGHSIIYWAGVYAESSGWGPDLGLGGQLQIKWAGWQGMKWTSLLSTLWKEVLLWGHPHTVIIQMGENDLLESKGVVLSRTIMRDLETVHWKLPESLLFRSCLLECRVWRGALDPAKVDLGRRRACKAVVRFLNSMGRLHDQAPRDLLLPTRRCIGMTEFFFQIGAWISDCRIFTTLCGIGCRLRSYGWSGV